MSTGRKGGREVGRGTPRARASVYVSEREYASECERVDDGKWEDVAAELEGRGGLRIHRVTLWADVLSREGRRLPHEVGCQVTGGKKDVGDEEKTVTFGKGT
eukprot:1421859-Rhodomonas_salina.2